MNNIKEMFNRLRLEAVDNLTCHDDLQRFNVECFNESEGNLDKEDGIHCPKCKNKGWIQAFKGGYVTTYMCKCMAKRDAVKKARSSGLGEYLNKDLSDYEVTKEWQRRCKMIVENYLQAHSDDNVWFMACGQSGSGKTLLCSIIANNLLVKKGRSVMYVIWTDFVSKCKRDMMSEKSNDVSARMEEVKNVDVLFLDEVLKKYNETDLKYLIEIINYRSTNGKKTILTSERLMTELIDVDEATFGRAVEKCKGFMINIPKDRAKNYRIQSIDIR